MNDERTTSGMAGTTGGTRQDVENVEPVTFSGFGSPQPLLMERPSRYLRRLDAAAHSIFAVPDDDPYGGVDGRILYSPAVSLPFFLMRGNEVYASRDAASYPLLHAPRNRMPGDDDDPTVYALTLVALYEASGVMLEREGDILAYGVDGEFDVQDDMWDACADWANDVAGPLADLNRARLLGYALKDRVNEARPLSVLFDAWQVEQEPEEVIDAGKRAAEALKDDYKVFLECDFDPWREA